MKAQNMKPARLHSILETTGWVLADGATGTNLFRAGLETGYPPELWNVERPEDITALHTSFIDAGSQLILTNSFGGTAHRLRLHAADDRVGELNLAAAKLARQAADDGRDRHGHEIVVAGSIGPTGELFEPMGALDHADALAAFTEQAEALAAGGVDLLWIETMSSLEEVKAAIEAASAVGLPAASCMTFDTAARSMMGVTPADFASKSIGFGADYVGANCGIGPAELLHSVSEIITTASVPVIAKGNCGIPAYLDGAIHYHGTPELMADYACLARDAGVRIIGGCCGTTPDHVAAMRAALVSTPQYPFDQDRVDAALGPAWKDLPSAVDQDSKKRTGGRRRSRRSNDS
jgi:5-methyltetrahydrofolate--homocysteine methyltransferase